MSFWTTGHEEVLREYAHQGAQAVSDAIMEQFGAYHSPHAVEQFAHRVHVSLRKMQECPECGNLVDHLNRQTGMCARCSEVYHVERARAYNQILEEEAAEAESQRAAASREYATLRQRNSRLRKRIERANKGEDGESSL
ncbi:hypothetical protein [Olsenella phocaeensis]|uniref:hypothetical protein n=1 Tax=Olsenella phocaeensis TaxID=1852385 RepID=UPI003A905309